MLPGRKTGSYSVAVLPFRDGHDNAGAVEAVLAGNPVTLRYPGLLDSRINFISGFLFRLLSRLNIGFLTELMVVLLKELTSNCSKANAKRIFLEERKLSVGSKEEYTSAIARFSEEVLADWDAFLAAHLKSTYYIDVTLQRASDALELVIENNVQLLPFEWERIKTRIESFHKYQSIDRAFAEIRDTSEGAGLGIVMTLLLLRNAGIPPDSFRLVSGEGRTRTTVRIPLELTQPEVAGAIKSEILAECEALPSFPESINSLIQLCNSDSVSLQVIAERIQRDPGLTAQILRVVNSAGYMSRNRNPSLTDAVKIIGLKVIRNLLMVSGARNVINSRYRYRELEQIWDGANRVSFFARRLARRKDTTTAELATVAGLLFELGKIILFSMRPEFERKVQELQGAGRIRSSHLLEEIALGISHPEIGALVAAKWKFPAPLVAAIRFQQKPLDAPAEDMDLVHCVYMGIRIQEAAAGRSHYYSVEPEILEEFEIDSPTRFATVVEQMTKSYAAEAGDAG